MHICEYCNKEFKTKCNLNRHQKQTKYCLDLQGESLAVTDKIVCDCGKSYTRNDNYKRHKKKCLQSQTPKEKSSAEELAVQFMEVYGDIIKEMQRQNGDFQKQLTELSARPTKVTHNGNVVLNSLQPITDEDLQENLDDLKIDFILDGAKGYANFARCYPLRNNIVCTDKARKKIKYRDENGEITDNSRLLAQRFFQAISERNKTLLNAEYKDIHNEIQGIVSRGKAGEEDVIGLLSKATNIQDILVKSQQAATGEDDEFTQEFLSHLAKNV